MAVTISGMFGEVDGQVHTYFAGSPVVIDIAGLEWSNDGSPVTSPFTIVRVEVIYNNNVVGEFHADTGGQSSISFDISSALRTIWSDYDFDGAGAEIAKANAAISGVQVQAVTRAMREYSLHVMTEYLASDDGGTFTTTDAGTFTGGKCLIGGLTEWERSLITDNANRDVSSLEHSNPRNGDASTKPVSSPERVGKNSITSWVDVREVEQNNVMEGQTLSIFYPATYNNGNGQPDDVTGSSAGWTGHAPIVLRDSIPYIDFLFLNRRGAVETCSGVMKESMGIDVDTKEYSRVGRPAFKPSSSLMAIGSDGRRSWQMSSGYVTREWAEWWAMEFLAGKRKQWWMRYPLGSATGVFVPVTVKPAKSSTGIYDRAKQQMPHVDFTVTLALEG